MCHLRIVLVAHGCSDSTRLEGTERVYDDLRGEIKRRVAATRPAWRVLKDDLSRCLNVFWPCCSDSTRLEGTERRRRRSPLGSRSGCCSDSTRLEGTDSLYRDCTKEGMSNGCSDSTRLEGTERWGYRDRGDACHRCSDSTRLEGTERFNRTEEREQALLLQRLDPLGGY